MQPIARPAGLALACAAVVIAAPSAQTPQAPTFRAGVNVVRVDVIVSGRDGQPVTDLTAADFQVTEDGRPQRIDTVKLVTVDGTLNPTAPQPRAIRSEQDEELQAAREDVRLYVILLDDYHVRRSSAVAVRQALTTFIQKQLAPSDLCAIMYPVTPVGALALTRDRDSLLAAVRRFEGRKFDYRPRHPTEEQYATSPPAVVERIRNEVTLSALTSLSTRLGSLREARKSVILVSEGFSNVLPAQLTDPALPGPTQFGPRRRGAGTGAGTAGGTDTGTATGTGTGTGTGRGTRTGAGSDGAPGVGAEPPLPPDPMDDPAVLSANSDLLAALRAACAAATRNNTAVYAFDPRGLVIGEFAAADGAPVPVDRQYLQTTLDTLRTLAAQTDGRAIVNGSDIEAGLRQVVQDASVYYLIGYTSTNTSHDGKFHEIKVRTKRPGVQVRARAGYWALTKEQVARSAEPPAVPAPAAVTRSLGSVAEPIQGRFVRSWIGTERGEHGRTRVTFVWEPPPTPGVERGPAVAVSVQASAAGRSFYDGAVKAEDGRPRAMPARAVFDADPGAMHVRVTVTSEDGTPLDTDVRDVQVPDFTSPRVALSTPEVFRTFTAHEFQALASDPSPVPAATREFRRTERLVVRFHVYGPGTESPLASARVLNRAGVALTSLEVRPPEAPATWHQFDLRLAGFAPGEYVIEIRANGPSGEAKALVPLKITN